METKTCELQKARVTDEGTFEGYLAVNGNIDSQRERLLPGAFAKDFAKNGRRRPCLWQHDPAQPIGWLDLTEDSYGLRARGKLLIDDVDRAREAFALMKNKVVTGLSIGFETIKHQWNAGVRELVEAQLFEGSCVTFPANTAARISDVKAVDLAALNALNEMLRDVRSLRTDHELKQLIAGIRAIRKGL